MRAPTTPGDTGQMDQEVDQATDLGEDQLNELGFYVLAGAPQSPVELIGEVGAVQ